MISLELVDPRFYHLDIALAVLDDGPTSIALLPAGLQRRSSRAVLRRLFPDAIIATAARRVRVRAERRQRRAARVPARRRRTAFGTRCAAAGYWPMPIDLSELLKGGGSVKCCTQEIRPSQPGAAGSIAAVEVSSLIPTAHPSSQEEHRDHVDRHPYPRR